MNGSTIVWYQTTPEKVLDYKEMKYEAKYNREKAIQVQLYNVAYGQFEARIKAKMPKAKARSETERIKQAFGERFRHFDNGKIFIKKCTKPNLKLILLGTSELSVTEVDEMLASKSYYESACEFLNNQLQIKENNRLKMDLRMFEDIFEN